MIAAGSWVLACAMMTLFFCGSDDKTAQWIAAAHDAAGRAYSIFWPRSSIHSMIVFWRT